MTAPESTAVADAPKRTPSTALAKRAVRGRSVARRLPRPQSVAVEPSDESSIGETELGRIDVAESVVARLASRAAAEVDDVGAAAPRLLGVDLSSAGLDKVGVRSSSLGGLPSASATVDGSLAFLKLTMSVRYPASVRQVAAAVRSHVRERVGELTGLQVLEVDITVPALVSASARRPRVL